MADASHQLEPLLDRLTDWKESNLRLAEYLHCQEQRIFFLEESCVCAAYADEIREALTAIGLPIPPDGGTTMGSFNLVWMRLEAALGLGDESLLSAAYHRKQTCIRTYETMLDQPNLPTAIRTMLYRQYTHMCYVRHRLQSFMGHHAA